VIHPSGKEGFKMRARTTKEIAACPHDRPFVEICYVGQQNPHGDYTWRITGCSLCGGTRRELVSHLNFGSRSPHKPADRAAYNEEEYDRYRALVRSWRHHQPEPTHAIAAPSAEGGDERTK